MSTSRRAILDCNGKSIAVRRRRGVEREIGSFIGAADNIRQRNRGCPAAASEGSERAKNETGARNLSEPLEGWLAGA